MKTIENELTEETGFTSSRPSLSSKIYREVADRLGISLSIMCIIHCLLTPVVLIAIPSLQAMGLHQKFHATLLILLPLIALLAFIPGFRRHGEAQVFYWSVPGFIALAYALYFLEPYPLAEAGVSILGSSLLVRAHFLNRRFAACTNEDHAHGRHHGKNRLPERRLRPKS